MNFDSELVLAHLNTRREKAGEGDGPVAMDAKVTGRVPIEVLAGCFATLTGYAQLAALWREDGNLVTGEWGPMTLVREGIGIHAEIGSPLENSGPPLAFNTANFNKLRLTPLPGRVVDFSARLQVVPAEHQVEALVGWLGKCVKVKVELAQKELGLVGGTDVAGHVAEEDGDGDQQESLLDHTNEGAAGPVEHAHAGAEAVGETTAPGEAAQAPEEPPAEEVPPHNPKVVAFGRPE